MMRHPALADESYSMDWDVIIQRVARTISHKYSPNAPTLLPCIHAYRPHLSAFRASVSQHSKQDKMNRSKTRILFMTR